MVNLFNTYKLRKYREAVLGPLLRRSDREIRWNDDADCFQYQPFLESDHRLKQNARSLRFGMVQSTRGLEVLIFFKLQDV